MCEDTVSIEFLNEILSERYRVPKVEQFKLVCAQDLCHKKDLFLVAPGESKIEIIAAPAILWQVFKQRVIGFLVVPSKELMEEHAKALRAFGIRAVAINDDSLRQAEASGQDLWDEVLTGDDVRFAVVTPPMMNSERAIAILNISNTTPLTLWVFLDEVQLFNESVTPGSPPPYRGHQLERLRARLRPWTLCAAFASSISASEARDIASELGFRPGSYVDARYSLNPLNIEYVARFMAYPAGSDLRDLAWIIPFDLLFSDEIPTTLIYCQSLELGSLILSFLGSLIPDHIPDRYKLVRLYSAAFSENYRSSFQDDMKTGTPRVGICTDPLTYGINIPNVRRVVVFGEVESYARITHATSEAGRNGQPAAA